MKLTIDEQTNALYFRMNESGVVESKEVSPGVILGFRDQNEFADGGASSLQTFFQYETVLIVGVGG